MSSPSTLFWLGCVPARIGLAVAAKEVVPGLTAEQKWVVSAAAALPAAVWLTGALPRNTNFAGQEVWWDAYRPVHGALWAWYAATLDYRSLVLDVLFGMYVHTTKSGA